MTRPQDSAAALTTKVGGTDHLILMRCIEDDRFGNPDKVNGAYIDRDAPHFVTSEHRRTRSYDSVLNALPVEHYHRICGLEEVTGLARFSAPSWRLRILTRTANLAPELLHEETGTGVADLALPVALSGKPYRLYFELSWAGALSVDLLAWSAPKPDRLQPLGVSITTYNKAAYLLPNLATLAESAAYGAGMLDILVVNNGDPLPEAPDMAEVKPLPNVGGTGGFLAGHAHFRKKGYRHFVIMDDDIAILPDFIDRLYAMSCFARGMHVGTMAEILNTAGRIVKEQGANVSASHTFGIDLINPFTDLQGWDRHRVYGFYEADFSGWWSLMVDLDGPAPAMPEKQFIKRDDIMFGYESRRQDVVTVVPPNLVVAHGEEGAPAYYYYDIRNDLILRARNADRLSLSLKQLVRIAGYLMLSLQADRQKMFNAALADFLAGPAALQASDIGQTLKRVRAMASRPQPIPPQPKALTARDLAQEAEASDQSRKQARPRLGGGDRPPPRALLRDWITPSAWSTSDPLPIVESNPLLHARGQGAYLDVIPFTDTAYLRKRQAAAPFRFLHALWLIARLYGGRKRLLKAYKDGRTTP
ncbi:glycosyltransferase family 2 protein [Ponticoccus sp. (in: a-proteobacteria)]|uniref:glycosyltransferase family 2 protein n=1 Tax=Ponticoccus sp. (in: a-proteobacteria) TaxID=1925025 RepID=UPI003AB51220